MDIVRAVDRLVIAFLKVAFACDISDECDPTSGADVVPVGTKVFKAFQDKLHNFPFQVGPCMYNAQRFIILVQFEHVSIFRASTPLLLFVTSISSFSIPLSVRAIEMP